MSKNPNKRTRVAVALVTAGAVVGLVGAAAAAPARAADLGDVWTVASAGYDCGAQTVTVTPTSNEEVFGDYDVYAYASVYDYDMGGWVTEPGWSRVDGITSHVFYGVTSPYAQALVTYARQVSGNWTYMSDYVTIADSLDNAGPFCGAPTPRG